jgi:hypothetical protein
MPDEIPQPYNDREVVVDESNPGNVAYWAKRLVVSETTLRLLISIHGCQAEDLRNAIRKITGVAAKSSQEM